ncbi:adenosylcobinamide-GDP ribazoletransferase [Aquibium sp. LZ166]|uniref:Adenosylcobinamide-GDP ribazoletransferase n=1 Tax=Aquibium pacificus TaxID=3153579 RepID=A0ABV3SMC0_9HYPH
MSGGRFLDNPFVADILLCLGFFTRLPLPDLPRHRSFTHALWAVPVAGLVVGVVAGVAGGLALWLSLPSGAAAVLALAAGILVTGALHEDGAADVADGFGGGRTRGDKLTIMRDSRIGSYGTLALLLSALARWSAIAAIAAAEGGWGLLVALIAVHAGSRAVLPAFASIVLPARTDGLSAGLGIIDRNVALGALGLGFLALLPLGLGFAVLSALLLAAVFFGLAMLARHQIGGQTGDVLGALQQSCEIVLLLAAAAILT